MKDSQEVDYTIAKPDSSNEYGGEYDYYPNSGGLDKDDWNIFYDPDVPRGDGRKGYKTIRNKLLYEAFFEIIRYQHQVRNFKVYQLVKPSQKWKY